MIQPIMVTSQEPDGRIVQQTQYQIIRQSDDTDTQNQTLQVQCFTLFCSTDALRTCNFRLYVLF